MPFTDLDEHLAEAFGDCRSIGGFQPDLWIRPRRQQKRTPSQRQRDTVLGILWRSARRREAQSRALEAGERPWRCQRQGCCNLLRIRGGGGAPIMYCQRTCRMAKYDRDARRSPEARQRKRSRRWLLKRK